MKGDRVTKGSMYRRGAEVKMMKQGGYKWLNLLTWTRKTWESLK
jgi:hypothetical protein